MHQWVLINARKSQKRGLNYWNNKTMRNREEGRELEGRRLNGGDVRTFTVSVSKLYLLYNALCISCAMEKKMML